MPKPKFSFRSRKKLAVKDQKREEPQPPAVEKAKDERTNNGGSVPDMFANATSFADMSNQIVRLDDSQDKGTTDVLLSNLSRCIVLLTGRPISALHIKNLKECLVVCGAIQGSILTYGFTDSTIAIACHQVTCDLWNQTDKCCGWLIQHVVVPHAWCAQSAYFATCHQSSDHWRLHRDCCRSL